MDIRAKLILDLGNSETRCVVKFKNEKTGKKTRKRFNLSNRFYLAADGMVVPENYTTENTSVIKIEGDYTGTYINGEMVLKEYEKICTKPTAARPKYSLTSVCSFALAIVKATKLIAKAHNLQTSDVNVEWNIVTLLPPRTCKPFDINLMCEELRKLEHVTDIYTENRKPSTLNVNIKSVKVYPECFAGYVGCMYDYNAEVRKGYEKYVEDTTLCTDIGAGTSDIVVVADAVVLDNTRESFDIGGNTVRAKLKKLVRDKYNYSRVLDSQLEDSMRIGTIKDGQNVIDVTEEVMKAKCEVAQAFVNDVEDYMEGVDFSLRSIGSLLVLGGGTLGGNKEKIRPISEYIVEFLKEFAHEIELVPLPTMILEEGESYFDNDGKEITAEKKIEIEISPRELNIIGAEILSDLEEE